GSGEYRVKLYVKIPTGQKVVKLNKVIRMRLSPEDEMRLKQMRENPAVAHLPNNHPVLSQAEIAAMISQGIAAAMPKPEPKVNMLEMMASFAGIIKTIMPQTTPAPVQAQQFNPMELIKGVVSVVKDINSRGRGSDEDDDDAPRRGSTNNYDLLNN